MAEQSRKKHRLSPRARTLIGVAIIVLVTILALLFAPPEGESNNTTGDAAPGTNKLVITNLVSSTDINRDLDYNGVHIALSKAMLASKFSDDHKRAGTYTVRVVVQTKSAGQDPMGVDYASLVRLMLPDGAIIKTKLISVKAVQLPNDPQTGFFDFPVSTRLPLTDLKLQFDNATIIPFS